MAHADQAREKRIAELRREVTRRGFDRHAFRLSSVCELPADLQAPSLAALAGREAMQEIIVFPQQIQRGWQYVPKQALLFTANGVIHLLASIWPGQEPVVTCIDGRGLMCLKATLLLLYGYLEIVAQGHESLVRLGMEFNTVSWEAISVPLRRFLALSQTAFDRPADQIARPSQVCREISELPLKFFNGVHLYGLLPGEELQELVFQPSTCKRTLYFFRQLVTPSTLLLLTSNYMIAIQEDLKSNLGWLLTYIPRSGICGIQSQEYGLWKELTVDLEREGQFANCKFILVKQAVDAWQTRWMARGGQWQDLPNKDQYEHASFTK